jgi:hypothetical protein
MLLASNAVPVSMHGLAVDEFGQRLFGVGNVLRRELFLPIRDFNKPTKPPGCSVSLPEALEWVNSLSKNACSHRGRESTGRQFPLIFDETTRIGTI